MNACPRCDTVCFEVLTTCAHVDQNTETYTLDGTEKEQGIHPRSDYSEKLNYDRDSQSDDVADDDTSKRSENLGVMN